MVSVSDEPARLLVRALDTGGCTYISFRWLESPQAPWVIRLQPAVVAEVTALLDDALIGHSDDNGDAEVKRAIEGPLSRLDSEFCWSAALAEHLLDNRFRDLMAEHSHRPVTIEYTPSPAIARVPLDLLPVDGDRRLMECVELVCGPPASLHAGRARTPERWRDVADRPVLYIIDPDAPDNAGLRQVLPDSPADDDSNTKRLIDLVAGTPSTSQSGVHQRIGRWQLHDELLSNPSRLLYVGHVSSTLDQPGSASIHLADDEITWGLAAALNGSHRPLSALDLLYGTLHHHADSRGTIHRGLSGIPGHRLWPMPPRVAIIACEGGSDYRSTEIFGLVTACLNSGAGLVTTTRWTLPSDHSMRRYGAVAEIPGPTTELALAVDAAHRTADPVAALNSWQRDKLARWRATGHDSMQHSPLVWASITDHQCDWRAVQRKTA